MCIRDRVKRKLMLPLFAHSRHIAFPPVLVYSFGAIFGKITAVSYTHLDVYKRQVKGQEVKGVGSAAKHALPQPVLRVGFVWDFKDLLLSA